MSVSGKGCYKGKTLAVHDQRSVSLGSYFGAVSGMWNSNFIMKPAKHSYLTKSEQDSLWL